LVLATEKNSSLQYWQNRYKYEETGVYLFLTEDDHKNNHKLFRSLRDRSDRTGLPGKYAECSIAPQAA